MYTSAASIEAATATSGQRSRNASADRTDEHQHDGQTRRSTLRSGWSLRRAEGADDLEHADAERAQQHGAPRQPHLARLYEWRRRSPSAPRRIHHYARGRTPACSGSERGDLVDDQV